MARQKRRAPIVERRRSQQQPQALKHFDYLRILGKNAKNRQQRKALAALATKSQLRAVCECIENVLAQNIPVSNAQLQKLKRHKNMLRKLANRRLPVSEQRKLISSQSGGILGSIIPIALSALSPLIGGLFGKR